MEGAQKKRVYRVRIIMSGSIFHSRSPYQSTRQLTHLVHVRHHSPGVSQLVLVVKVEVKELVVPLVVLRQTIKRFSQDAHAVKNMTTYR